jgi:regulatory protein YycI of two-component signal transduction system YycFG
LYNQLKDEQQENELKQMVSESMEEKLKDIEYEVEIPKIEGKFTLISAKNDNLPKADFSSLEEKLTIEKTAGNSTYLTLIEPYPIHFSNNKELKVQIDLFLKEYVLYGNEYRLWKISEDNQSIILHQTYNQRPIFFGYDKIQTTPNGVLEMRLNEDGEIFQYKQTYLLISKQGNEQKVLSVEEAMINLFRNGYANRDSVVNKMELGYYSLISIENTQVFSPTWHIQVNERSYMVNAVDGTITEYNETE